MKIDDLPEIITAQQIADYLQISRKTVYELLQINPEYGGIKNISIGASKRVEKVDFIDWLQLKKRNTTNHHLKAVK
jgi:excisionase family DNA binding protein